jgi:hypothetical protein
MFSATHISLQHNSVNMQHGYCQYSQCPSSHIRLQPVGDQRANGSKRKRDWESRMYHCACYKRMKEDQACATRVLAAAEEARNEMQHCPQSNKKKECTAEEAREQEIAALKRAEAKLEQDRQRTMTNNRREATILFRAQQMRKDKRKRKKL